MIDFSYGKPAVFARVRDCGNGVLSLGDVHAGLLGELRELGSGWVDAGGACPLLRDLAMCAFMRVSGVPPCSVMSVQVARDPRGPVLLAWFG